MALGMLGACAGFKQSTLEHKKTGMVLCDEWVCSSHTIWFEMQGVAGSIDWCLWLCKVLVEGLFLDLNIILFFNHTAMLDGNVGSCL